MINTRKRLAAALRADVVDEMWDVLAGDEVVFDFESGRVPIEDVVARYRQIQAAVHAQERSPRAFLGDRTGGRATGARIDALTAIYAAAAARDGDVRHFRAVELVDPTTTAYADFLAGRGDYPTHRLLDDAEVGPWVLARFDAEAPDGDGQTHIRDLIAHTTSHGPRQVTDLWLIVTDTMDGVTRRQERAQTVPTATSLGRLAKLATELTNRYRWRPSEATMFVLTGQPAEVHVYVGSAQIRGGTAPATTRLTMELDPALTPDQVAAIYTRLRARFAPGPIPRSQGLRRYLLAGFVGPHLEMGFQDPAGRTGPGRRPRPTVAGGLVYVIQPAPGYTWTGLRQAWNTEYGDQVDETGRTLRIDRAQLFIRDAKDAIAKLLYPDWRVRSQD